MDFRKHAGGQAISKRFEYRRLILGMTELGKLLVFLGVMMAVAGVVLMLLGRTHLPGRLPGDFVYRGKHGIVYFPLATSILLSVVLSLVLYAIGRWQR